MFMHKVFPPTQRFVLVDGDDAIATYHISKGGFEDVARELASRALLHAKLRGRVIKARFEDAEPVLNAYPQGYTEVYR
jgi:hypothetical protein